MSQPNDNDPNAKRLWPFAERYEQILREGHQKQAPAIGSPTLIWHMALWPVESFGERQAAVKEGETTRERAKRLFEEYDEDNVAFFKELNAFALALQAVGRVGEAKELTWRKAEVDIPDGSERPHSFYSCDPQSLSFTLWWQDAAKDGVLNARQQTPAPTDMRVRVQLQTHRDHATVAFFIDVAKQHGETQLTTAADVYARGGERRPKILRLIDKVREVSGKQIQGGFVDMSRIPEQGVSEADAQVLKDAADYCYDGVWREFAQAFGLQGMLDRRTDEYRHMRKSDRFADFRGVVMSIRGIESPQKLERKALREKLRRDNATALDPNVATYLASEEQRDGYTPSPIAGTIGFGELTQFEAKSNEGNTILKSLWPFMRRITPWADYSDWVGCGIINGRALYITALGSEAMVGAANEEYDGRADEVPAGHLPDAETNPPSHPRSLRYLIVTKGEPLREQVGRFVERINALGTMRLFALRNMADIRNAGIQIEVLGRMLDGTLRVWERERQAIENWYQEQRKNHRPKREPAFFKSGQVFQLVRAEIDPGALRIDQEHTLQLNELISKTEREIIAVASQLDNLGAGGYGRLLYAIRRASYFAGEFERMWQTLGIEDVDGWINYRNFVQRGMQPAFAYIRTTGDRLVSIRDRLQTITETIQTAALIVETGATRENTARLKQMAATFAWARGAAVVGLALWMYQLTLHDWFKPKIEQHLHPQFERLWQDACVGLGFEGCTSEPTNQNQEQ